VGCLGDGHLRPSGLKKWPYGNAHLTVAVFAATVLDTKTLRIDGNASSTYKYYSTSLCNYLVVAWLTAYLGR